MRRYADATLRNRLPIYDVLARHLRAGDQVLEIASGSGQHAVFLAPRLGVTWQPTDTDAEARASIDAWRTADPADPAGADTPPASPPACVLPARTLDVCAAWPVVTVDVLVCVNMIHISPWEATLGLLDGAAKLGPRVVYLYGPYRRGGDHTAPSNAAFDAWLQQRDPRFGVRDLDTVLAEAATRGYRPAEIVEMPANNLSVVLGPVEG